MTHNLQLSLLLGVNFIFIEVDYSQIKYLFMNDKKRN